MQQQSQLNLQISDAISEPGGRLQPTHVEQVRVLGNGRAATAVLVSATDYSGRETECVEKIFAPGLLTRFIYRAFFQAPFGYQANRDAIFACYYRRRVASQLIRVFVPEAAIAEPLYVRWNPEEGAYSLAAEFIKGRGIRPAPAFTRRLRNLLPWSTTPQQDAEQGEIDELLSLMSRLETLFRESGMVGSGWQVSKSAVVSTANLLRTESGYVVVDLESGIPAILVMHYVLAGLRLKSWPLFDDVDPQGLMAFIDQNSQQIEEAIGEDGLADLRCDIDSLIAHSKAWKAAEVSMFRSGLPFLSSEFQSRYRQQTLDHWCRTGRTDSETDQRYRNSARLYSRPIYWVGMLPGGLGKGLQKLCGNREARKRFRLFCTDRDYRKHRLGGFVDRKVVQFRQEQRLESKSKPVTFGLMFLVHWILSKVTPTRVHRLLVDGEYRQNQRQRIFLLMVSSRFQREFGQLAIRAAIESWHRDGRLQSGEYQQLRQSCESHELDEYARCFGMHLSIKLLSPILVPFKVGGVAAFLATGNLAFLLPIVLSPILRTAITATQMFRRRRGQIRYAEALLVGMLPVVGTVAFPVQMYASHSALSTFLIRDALARISCLIPVYGGRDSRTELAAMKAADFPIELIEIATNAVTKVSRLWAFRSRQQKSEEPVSTAISRWDAMAHQQLDLYRQELQSKHRWAEMEFESQPSSDQIAA